MSAAMTRLTLPVPPSANVYWRTVLIGMKPRILLSKAARTYRDDVLARCRAVGVRRLAGPVEITIAWHRDRKAGDLDNRIKPLLDALKGVAFDDDRMVYRLVAEIAPPDNSGARVDVTVAPYRPANQFCS